MTLPWKRLRGHTRLSGRRGTRVAIVAVLALAVALRAAAYLETPHPIAGSGLAAEQAEMARNIVDHGRWFVVNPKAYVLLKARQAKEHRLVDLSRVDFSRVDRAAKAQPVVDQMPGVALVLASLWWPTGDKTYALIQWLQILLDTVMVFLVYWIAVRLTGRAAVGLLAALLYAVWPKGITFASRPLLDTWASFFTIACVAVFLWARKRPENRWRLVSLGLLTGIGIYFRPFVVLVPIALALVATRREGWRRRLLWVAAPTAVALLVLAPWTIRNYYEYHRFIPTRTGLGQAVFEGTGQASTDEKARAYVHRHEKHAGYGTPSYDAVLLRGAITAIAHHPGFYLRLVAHRGRRLLPCLLVLLVWRRWRRPALILLAVALAVVVPYLLIGDDGRFYLPMFFAYFILLAMAADVTLSFAFRSKFISRMRATGTPPSAAEPRQR